MSLSRVLVAAVRVEGRPVAEVADAYGVSRQWVYVLLRRYDREDEAGLEPRSRRPHGNARQTPVAVEDLVVQLRKELTDAGLDAGAQTIRWHLRQAGTSPLPATSTIWRILTRRGFVTPQPQKRPRCSLVRFVAEQPNQMWQADITHWPLADGTDVEILNILDDHSRLLIASVAARTFTGTAVMDVFATAYTAHGLPASILTDNAAIFAGGPRGGRVGLERQADRLGIRVIHSRPYHPQTCGKVERFHQTLKKRLAALDPAQDLPSLQRQLDDFVEVYNRQRPHRALGRRTPAMAFAARPAASPAGIARRHLRLRTDVVNTGRVTLRHDSRLHHIGLGAAHNGTRVLMLIDGLHIRVITHDGRLLRELVLDTTRDYQPLGTRPGPKPRNVQ